MDQTLRRTIQVDHKGKAITSGIPIHNHKEYAAATGVGWLLLHFLLVPFVTLYAVFVLAFLGLCTGPGLAVIAIDGHAHRQAGVIAGLVFALIGLAWWTRKAWQWTRKLIKGFSKHTRFHFVGDYNGPLGGLIAAVEKTKRH